MHELNRPIAVLALLILSALFGLTAPADATDIPFDAARWKAAAGHYDGRARVLMIDSLRNTYLKDWMTQADVEALLGPPDIRFNQSSSYYVGSSYGFSGSDGWGYYYHLFSVPFDPRGKISGRGSISYPLKEKARAAPRP